MSGKFLSAGDAVGDALGHFAGTEISEPADVEECPRAVGAWYQDVGYALSRKAAELEETGIHPSVVERLWDAAGAATISAHAVEDLVHFSLARRP